MENNKSSGLKPKAKSQKQKKKTKQPNKQTEKTYAWAD